MTPWTIHEGHSLDVLRTLPDASVQTCVTSPPYFGLRDYGTGSWTDGDPACEHRGRQKPRQDTSGGTNGRFAETRGTQAAKSVASVPVREICSCGARRIDLQVGLEATPAAFVDRLVEIFREVRRVLRDDGTLWLNLGDSYANRWASQRNEGGAGIRSEGAPRERVKRTGASLAAVGLKDKDLIGVPWRVAFALQADGWWLRSDIIWSKPNPMPESVTDRPTRSHEYVFLLAKSERYYFDGDAVREPDVGSDHARSVLDGQPSLEPSGGLRSVHRGIRTATGRNGEGRNIRSVWRIATEPFPGAHFATFPTKLVEPCILAGAPRGGVVLDPFSGAGTTGLVAHRLGRAFVGIELNPEYAAMARRRIIDDAPLLSLGAGASA